MDLRTRILILVVAFAALFGHDTYSMYPTIDLPAQHDRNFLPCLVKAALFSVACGTIGVVWAKKYLQVPILQPHRTFHDLTDGQHDEMLFLQLHREFHRTFHDLTDGRLDETLFLQLHREFHDLTDGRHDGMLCILKPSEPFGARVSNASKKGPALLKILNAGLEKEIVVSTDHYFFIKVSDSMAVESTNNICDYLDPREAILLRTIASQENCKIDPLLSCEGILSLAEFIKRLDRNLKDFMRIHYFAETFAEGDQCPYKKIGFDFIALLAYMYSQYFSLGPMCQRMSQKIDIEATIHFDDPESRSMLKKHELKYGRYRDLPNDLITRYWREWYGNNFDELMYACDVIKNIFLSQQYAAATSEIRFKVKVLQKLILPLPLGDEKLAGFIGEFLGPSRLKKHEKAQDYLSLS